MKLSDQEKIYFIEGMNQLLTDQKLSRIRQRAVSWVDDRLERNLLDRLQKQGEITSELWNLFLQGDKTVFFDIQKKLFELCPFSREEKRELKVLSEMDPSGAAHRMKSYLMKKERTAFQKGAGISAMSWSRFLNVSA
ncbi:MAG: hypothetical protein II983_03780, partial [Firmicutes bacterium]|nr:hypothetical protein [Bacillota bacterium]